MRPTIRERPFKYVRDLCFSREAPFRSRGLELGSPRAE